MSDLAWLLLVYRVPSEPASKRVGVWRELKRLGALYLQQCVCIVPQRAELADELEQIVARITALEGEATLFEIPRLRPGDEARVLAAFRELRDKEYAEIVEECATKFVKEIEFEHFRQNYSYAESEEIAQDLEKIRRWFARVVARDWFGGARRGEVEAWIDHCQALLDGFEHAVYQRQGDDGGPQLPVLPLAPLPIPLPSREGNEDDNAEDSAPPKEARS
ncbi:MAG TPA: Chromate resistance protein ChrB [Thermomicrobiaceae bacterium]|nr:Chromate resistance protein ChrB [Thermomicrobiaceae bacterium]